MNPAAESRPGALVVNADDWGRDPHTTDRILDCVLLGAVSAVSGMVFMEDSERAAALAREHHIDVGLHLNFTAAFTAPAVSARLAEEQRRIAAYLRSSPLAQVMFHPGLAGAFNRVVNEQFVAFERLYGASPARIDGHHHMHLCANVLFGNLLPAGTMVRRNFYFAPGDKSVVNRAYRAFIDRRLARRHRLTDFLFNIQPLVPEDRLRRIFTVARSAVVELETHPDRADEYRFLREELAERLGDASPMPFSALFACG